MIPSAQQKLLAPPPEKESNGKTSIKNLNQWKMHLCPGTGQFLLSRTVQLIVNGITMGLTQGVSGMELAPSIKTNIFILNPLNFTL